MKTANPIIHWVDLFDANGTPLPHFQSTINERRTSLLHKDNITHEANQLHSIVLWNKGAPQKVHKCIENISAFLDNKTKKMNGTAQDCSFVGVQLPERNPHIISKKLSLHIRREKSIDPFGKWLWQEFQESNFNIHSLATLILHIDYNVVYVKDPTTENIIQLDTLNAKRNDTGIYVVIEHIPEVEYPKIVYVGKSFGALRTTIYCHFHEWKDKYRYYPKHRAGRAEDRGKWREKILDHGYQYSIGTIRIPRSEEGFPGITHQQLLNLERKLIQIFSPRDNIKDRTHFDNYQMDMFDSPEVLTTGVVTVKSIQESQQTPDSTNDDPPF